MGKIRKQLLILFSLLLMLILPYLVFASDPAALKNLEDVGMGGGFATGEVNEYSVAKIAGTAVAAALGLLGVIFIVLTIYGGFLWMTAQGNTEQVEKAKNIIKNSIIGLIIIVACSAIYVIIYKIIEAGLT